MGSKATTPLPNLSARAKRLLPQLACSMGRRDQVPNQELGWSLAAEGDGAGVAALVELLALPREGSDALKALYECGYRAPELLVPHADLLLDLLDSGRNRLVWGGMIAAWCVAQADPEAVWRRRKVVLAAFETGTVITRDAAIHALAEVASSSPARSRALAGFFIRALTECRPKDVPRWGGLTLPAMGNKAGKEARAVIQGRLDEMNASGRKRAEKLL